MSLPALQRSSRANPENSGKGFMMDTRFLGQSGLQVGALALGGWTFGRETDAKMAWRLLDQFCDHGGNLIDTAEGYGDGVSEQIIGGWLADSGRRDQMVIATKVYGHGPVAQRGLSRKHVMFAAEASLRRLRTDYLDLFQVHCWDLGTPIDETLMAMESLVARGLVRYIGLSNFAAWQAMKAHMLSEHQGWSHVASLQTEYSLLERTPEWELIPACVDAGMGVLAWSPLGGGWLTGKHRRGETAPTPGTRVAETAEVWQPDSYQARANEKTYAIVESVEDIGRKRGLTASQVALGWLLHIPGVVPIVGARGEAQLLENLAVDPSRLTPHDLAALNDCSASRRPWLYDYIEREGRTNDRLRG
jgi:aryl-alcohol dehydrogenase-like predicted oxidoreductase